MAAVHLDHLCRALSRAISRRAAVTRVSSALITLLPLALAGADADARKRGKKKRRKKGGNSGGAPPSPPTPQGCVPTCAAGKACGPDGCGGSCGECAANETCQQGQCICVPLCADANACGPDSCGELCGSCSTAVTCQGSSLIREVCEFGVCTPKATPCAPGEVCFQNACCPPQPPVSCRERPMADGCGGTYPANCPTNCCDAPGGGLVCQAAPCP